MLIEFTLGLLATISCDVSKAAMGACGAECEGPNAGSFTICASQGIGSGSISTGAGSQNTNQPTPKPTRLCQYYVNGTIDQPTLGLITAWVPVGSRLCIGDVVPEVKPVAVYKSVETQISDQFSADASRPFAWWEPGDELEIDEIGIFHVSSPTIQKTGELFDQSAQIRFRPVGISWDFSDGDSGAGSSYQKSFPEVGNFRAQAFVDYEVDYKIGSGGWVQNAASWALSSNELEILVIDPPRRTLLVG